MKIVFDARMYGLEHAGSGRYIKNLLGQIEKQDKRNLYYILLRKDYYSKLNFKNRNFIPILADLPHYGIKEQLRLPLILMKIRPDLVHFPQFNTPFFWFGKKVVTIHDLIKHESTGPATTTKHPLFYWFKFGGYKFLIWWVVKTATKIIVPSRWTARKLMAQYRLTEGKTVVVYEGVDENFSKTRSKNLPKNILKKYGISKPFVIYTGSLYPHKNLPRLVEAIKKLDLNLVVVGSRNTFSQRFKQQVSNAKAEKLVTLTGFIPDEELISLYEEAEAFVFPSLLEGFGLPGLEAMACGCPVVASDSSCLPEVYGDAAIYFNPLDSLAMANAIDRLRKDPNLKKKLQQRGYRQVAKFSWEKAAQQTIKIYEDSLCL